MRDRELLEKAAKAAGIEVRLVITGTMIGWFNRRVVPEPEPPYSKWLFWNPLEDDSDAFRLMVELEIEVEFYQGFQEVRATPYGSDMDGVSVEYTNDRARDVRLAIVRAATMEDI